jgi:voltage-gated potassium channel
MLPSTKLLVGYHMTLRKALSEALDPTQRLEKGLSITNRWIVALICISIGVGIAETEASLTVGYEGFYVAAHLAFFCIFLIEYIARIYAAPENPNHKSSFAYALTLSSVLDLLVLVSFVLPFLGLEASLLRVFRAARLVRLAKMGRYSLALQMIYTAMTERKYELGVSILIAVSLMLLSSTALYFAEREAQPDMFGSIPRAMWWAIATLTTVGYGDIVPITIMGRIAAGLTAVTGIGLIALPTGILASAFTDGLSRIKRG